MAFAATTIWEMQTAGADGTSGNGGGFDPANANMATDLAATSATGNSPVVTSASYNFIARDVGHWLFVKSGSNWTPGWYQIVSVAANAATLSAAIGAAVLYKSTSGWVIRPSVVAGCATTASPSGGTWSIDYSQSTAAGITYADLVIAVTTTDFTSAGFPVGPNIVGNIMAVSGGINFTVQRAQIVSVSGTTATCDKSLGTAAAVAGAAILGGAFASPGQASALRVGGNAYFVKSGTYTISSATADIAGGCINTPTNSGGRGGLMIGYNSVRGDFGTRPLLQASGINTFTVITVTSQSSVQNINVDGAALTSSRGISFGTNNSCAQFCKVINCKNSAFSAGNLGATAFCEASGCTTAGAAFNGGSHFGSVAHDNTVTGFITGGQGVPSAHSCLSYNNTGATSDGFSIGTAQIIVGCTSYANGRHGFNYAGGNTPGMFANCLAVNNTGYGFNLSSPQSGNLCYSLAGYNNTLGDVLTTIDMGNTFITLTANPFVDASTFNFSLNNVAGGGVACKAAGVPGAVAATQLPGLNTLSYSDVGAAQHLDSGVVMARAFTGF